MPNMSPLCFRKLFAILAAGWIGSNGPTMLKAEDITVFAAASLKNALDDIAAKYSEDTSHTVTVSYAGSSALARQIQHGAPADIFISANVDWMDWLERKDMLVSGTRTNLLGNALVLVTADDTYPMVEISSDLDIVTMLGEGRLAVAMVDAVPAGIYTKSALETLGLWDGVAGATAQTDNVRSALALVSVGEAPLGVTYASDAQADGNIRILGTFPSGSHPPIIYPAAAIANSRNPLNQPFMSFLASETAWQSFKRHGFVRPSE